MVRTGSLRTDLARHRVDRGTICGRSCPNSGRYKPLRACVHRTLSIQIRRAGVQKKFGGRAAGSHFDDRTMMYEGDAKDWEAQVHWHGDQLRR